MNAGSKVCSKGGHGELQHRRTTAANILHVNEIMSGKTPEDVIYSTAGERQYIEFSIQVTYTCGQMFEMIDVVNWSSVLAAATITPPHRYLFPGTKQKK